MTAPLPTGYRSLVARHWRILCFGGVLMALSSAGQTFFIALSGARIRQDFQLSDGDFGTAYAAATIASAATMAWVGRLVDTVSVRRFTMAVGLVLAGACLLLAWSPNLPVLVLSLYLLRLAGQGLMAHTAMTTIARALPADRGKAIGLAALGLALGEALFPIAAVRGIGALDWRPVWLLCAGAVLLGLALALTLARPGFGPARAMAAGQPPSGPAESALWRDPAFLRRLPILLCSPFITTAMFFHQTRLAQEKGWALGWIASWFVAYAVARAGSLVLVGPLLDRRSAAGLLPWLAMPLGLAMGVIALVGSDVAVPLYMLLFGLGAAASGVRGTALWAELYGTHRLGRIRALTEGGNVLASGLAPALTGLLIDRGVSLSTQALGLAAVVAVAGLCARDPAGLLARRRSRGSGA